MSWKNRAQPVEPQSSWKTRAIPETPTKEPFMGEGLIRGALQALPAAGGLAGGLLGSAAGPAGTFGGAVLGAGGGRALQNIGEGLLGDEQTREDIYMGPVKDAAYEAAGIGVGGLLASGAGKVAQLLPKKAPNASKIIESAQKLGVEATPGMTTESYFLKGLEDDLAKSPTIGGALTRQKLEPVKESIENVTKKSLVDASSLSPFEAGNEMKKGLIGDISERYQPIQMAYDDVSSVTKDIGLNPQGQARVAKNIRGIEGTKVLPELASEAEIYAKGIEGARSAKDLQLLKSKAKESLRNLGASFEQKQIAREALDKIDRFEANSIMREAVAAARTKGEGRKIGKDIVGNLKSAAKEYRQMMGDIGTLAKGSKVTSGKYGVSNILKEIDEIPSEKLGESLFKTNDNEFLNFLKDKHPKVFDEARKQKIAQVLKKSISPQDGQVSPRKFLQAIKDFGPEARKQLFGAEANNLDDIQTIIQSIPETINPSGTARSQQFKQSLNPYTQAMDLGRYGLYKTLSGAEKLQGKVKGTEGLLRDPLKSKIPINLLRPYPGNDNE